MHELRPTPPSGSPPDSVPRRLRRVQSENAFAAPPASRRLGHHHLVLPPNACLPERPDKSPMKSPRASALRSYRRDRILRSSSMARVSIIAMQPKAKVAIPRSRSASSIRPCGQASGGLTSSPSLLPPNFVPRARSAPMLRPSLALESPGDQQRARLARPHLPQHVGSLGASLRYPLGPEMMLHANVTVRNKAEPFVLQAAVPAAKLYMDPTSGRSIHLRCC